MLHQLTVTETFFFLFVNGQLAIGAEVCGCGLFEQANKAIRRLGVGCVSPSKNVFARLFLFLGI